MYNRIKQRSINLSFGTTIISIIGITIFKPSLFSDINDVLILIFIFVLVINSLIYINALNNLYYNWLRFDVLFMLGYMIVHLQLPFLLAIGAEFKDQNEILQYRNVINYAVWLSTLVGLIWQFGSLLYLKRIRNIRNYYPRNQPGIKIRTGPIDILILVLFSIFLSVVGPEFLGGAYDGVRNWGPNATYIFLLLSSLISLRIIYLYTNNSTFLHSKKYFKVIVNNKLFIFILLLYCLIFFQSSDRGEIMVIAILLGGGYSYFIKPMKGIQILVLIISSAYMFTLLQLGRSSNINDTRDTNILNRGIEEFNYEENINPTFELASSGKNLYRAIDKIPHSHPYLFGLTHFSNIVNVIPLAGSRIIQELAIPVEYTSSTILFSVWDKGIYYTSGVGSEIIADVYINYGVIGCIIIFFIFGYFISILQFRMSFNPSHIDIIIYLILLSISLYINRSILLDPLKTLFYVLFFDLVFRHTLKMKVAV